MKHLHFLLIVLLAAMFALTACSENDNITQPQPPELSDVADMMFNFPTDLTGFVPTDVEYDGATTTGYALDQFAPLTDLDIDADELVEYNFQIVANDGWSPRQSSYTVWDLTWAEFASGYLLPELEKPRVFFPSENIVSGYNVKYPSYVNMYRTIKVTGDDGLVTPFEVSQYELVDVTYYAHDDDPETSTYQGFPITDIITNYVTDAPAAYSYVFTAADGWVNDDSNNTFNWETMQKGWWIPEKNRVVFVGDDSHQLYKTVKAVIAVALSE